MRDQILRWIEDRIKSRPYVLGLNAPQGAGKTTLSHWICAQLKKKNIPAVSVSIDDFYLTRAQQIQLAERYSQNPYLQQRGYPGTHDIPLGAATLQALKNIAHEPVYIPRYDKSAFGGKGDRMAKEHWTQVRGPLKLILVEGWMLGFQPVPSTQWPNSHFEEINRFLASYSDWTQELDGFLQLKPDDFRHVLKWRVEAEEKMKASGKPGLPPAEIRAYAELFMPAYETYLPTLATGPILGSERLTVPIGIHRLPN